MPTLRYIDFVVLAITSIYGQTKNPEMTVVAVREEATKQSKKIRFGFSSQARTHLTKGLITLRTIKVLAFLRDDEDAGRWEDHNSLAVAMSQARRRFSQLQCIVVRGGDGQPVPEDGLDEFELKTLHAARHHCFKQLTGRTPPMLTAIQSDRINRKLAREKAELESCLQDAMNEPKTSVAPMGSIQGSTTFAIGPSRASTPDGSDSAPTTGTPSAMIDPLGGPSWTEKAQRPGPLSPSRAGKPLRRTYTSSGSAVFGGLVSPKPTECRLPDDDTPIDTDEPMSYLPSSPPVIPVTPCAQRTQVSTAHLAYPSPVSATRPNAAADTSNLGFQGAESPSIRVQADSITSEPSDLLNRAKGIALAFLWPRLGPFVSRVAESAPENFQGLDAVVKEQESLRARITQRDQEKAVLQKQVDDLQNQACGPCGEKDEEITSLRKWKTDIIAQSRARHEENGRWLDGLLPTKNATASRSVPISVISA